MGAKRLKRGVSTGKSLHSFSLFWASSILSQVLHHSGTSPPPFFRLCAIQSHFSWLALLTFHSFSSPSFSLCLCPASLPPLRSTASSLCGRSVIFRDNGAVAVIDFNRGVSEWRVCVTAEPSAPCELPIIKNHHCFLAGPFSSILGLERKDSCCPQLKSSRSKG